MPTKPNQRGNLPDKEFRIMIVKLIQNLEIKMESVHRLLGENEGINTNLGILSFPWEAKLKENLSPKEFKRIPRLRHWSFFRS